MKHFIQYQMKLLELVCDKLEIDYSEHKKKAWAINQKKYEEYQKQYGQEVEQGLKPRKPYRMSDKEFERLLNLTEDEYIDLQGSYVVACKTYDQKLRAIAEYQYEQEANPLVLKQLMDERRKLAEVKDNLGDSLTVADDNRKIKEKIKQAQ